MATKKKKKTAKKAATRKKAGTKKATAKKAAPKKATKKKSPTKKTTKKKTTAKKAGTKKKVAKKAKAKKATAKKAVSKKKSSKKSTQIKSAKKKTTAKKAASKKKAAPKSTGKKPAKAAKAVKAKKTPPTPRLSVGDLAPTFTLPSDTGETISLEEFRGQKNIVLYFYPKDDTPGCTVEACNFRDDLHEITDLDAVVLGVSADDLDSHAKFRNKFNLNFPLLADLGAEVAQTYGAYGEKNMYGRKYFGVMRSTFVIDKEGRIAAVWPKVKVEEHSKEVQEVLRGLIP